MLYLNLCGSFASRNLQYHNEDTGISRFLNCFNSIFHLISIQHDLWTELLDDFCVIHNIVNYFLFGCFLYLYPEVILDTASVIFCIVVSKSIGFFSKKNPPFPLYFIKCLGYLWSDFKSDFCPTPACKINLAVNFLIFHSIQIYIEATCAQIFEPRYLIQMVWMFSGFYKMACDHVTCLKKLLLWLMSNLFSHRVTNNIIQSLVS